VTRSRNAASTAWAQISAGVPVAESDSKPHRARRLPILGVGSSDPGHTDRDVTAEKPTHPGGHLGGRVGGYHLGRRDAKDVVLDRPAIGHDAAEQPTARTPDSSQRLYQQTSGQ
jgi:hypothetical protein